jgi:hypothetical protein
MGLVVTEVTTTPGTVTLTIELFRDLMGPRAALRDPLVEVMVLLQSSLMIEAMPIMDDHHLAPTVVVATETGGHLQGRTGRDRVSESDTCTTDFPEQLLIERLSWTSARTGAGENGMG